MRDFFVGRFVVVVLLLATPPNWIPNNSTCVISVGSVGNGNETKLGKLFSRIEMGSSRFNILEETQIFPLICSSIPTVSNNLMTLVIIIIANPLTCVETSAADGPQKEDSSEIVDLFWFFFSLLEISLL